MLTVVVSLYSSLGFNETWTGYSRGYECVKETKIKSKQSKTRSHELRSDTSSSTCQPAVRQQSTSRDDEVGRTTKIVGAMFGFAPLSIILACHMQRLSTNTNFDNIAPFARSVTESLYNVDMYS